MVTRSGPAGATRWWYWPWHTLLLGAYPALFLFAQNIADQLSLGPLWVPLLVSVAGAGAILVVCYYVRRDWLRAGLMASVALAAFFSFGHVWNVVSGFLDERLLLAAIWVVWAIGLIQLAWRGGRWVRPVSGFLNLAVAALVLYNAAAIGSYVASTRTAGATRGTIPETTVGELGRPDVYYIVLDRYAGEETLSRFYDFDNTPFLDALEERGFSVAHDSWANYFKTALSMFSTMTMEHIDGEEWGTSDPDTFGPIHQAFQERMSVPAAFKELGYEYVHIANWWEPTSTNVDADVIYRWTQDSEFSTILLSTTLASILTPDVAPPEEMHGSPLQRAHVTYGFDSIIAASTRQGPTFTLAHMTTPHPPYAFNPDGSLPTTEEREERTAEQEYIAQLEYTNRRVLEVIDQILANTPPDDPDPVIVLQTDEGPFPPRFARPNQANFQWLEATDEEIQWKFNILTAYRLPGVDAEAEGFYDEISPVNAFRIVFNAYFDAGLPLLSDVTRLSPDTDHMYDFVEYPREGVRLAR
jgi:hypothetical protein